MADNDFSHDCWRRDLHTSHIDYNSARNKQENRIAIVGCKPRLSIQNFFFSSFNVYTHISKIRALLFASANRGYIEFSRCSKISANINFNYSSPIKIYKSMNKLLFLIISRGHSAYMQMFRRLSHLFLFCFVSALREKYGHDIKFHKL